MGKSLIDPEFPELEIGIFVIIYEAGKPIDSGIIRDINTEHHTIDFQSASYPDKPKSTFVFNYDLDVWFPTFEGPDGRQCYNPTGTFFLIQEDTRRVPLVPKISPQS